MENNADKLLLLSQKVDACRACPLGKARTHSVFGKGSGSPDVVFIGEAPGQNEDLQGLPFVGAAGQLLDAYLDFIGLPAEKYYIANILKCRPPHNRDPLPEEVACCMPFLREQVKILSPRLIVCLGRISAQHIISPDFRITRQHGEWFQRGPMLVTATFHPAALLRDPEKKLAALEDFKKIKRKLADLSA